MRLKNIPLLMCRLRNHLNLSSIWIKQLQKFKIVSLNVLSHWIWQLHQFAASLSTIVKLQSIIYKSCNFPIHWFTASSNYLQHIVYVANLYALNFGAQFSRFFKQVLMGLITIMYLCLPRFIVHVAADCIESNVRCLSLILVISCENWVCANWHKWCIKG